MTRISRRALLAAPALLAFPLRAQPIDALHEAAKKEGEVAWYTAQYSGETAEKLANAFSARYPGVKVNVVRTTAAVLYQRIGQDLKAGVNQCDVVGSTDIGHYVELKQKGQLLKYVPENAAKAVAAVRDIDRDGFYHTTAAGLIAILYNKTKIKEADLPQSWPDLAQPKYKGLVSTGHPGFSGYVATWVVEMKKLYGWDYFEKLEKNKPQIGRSIQDTITMLNAGERAVAIGPVVDAVHSAAKGNPLGVVYPTDGTLLMITPSAIMKDARHPNAAKLFMEWLFSEDAAKVSVENAAISLRPEVKQAAGMKDLQDIKTIRPSDDEIVKGIPEVKELWRETFGV